MDIERLNSIWDEFLKEWSLDKVKKMSLGQYSNSGSKDTFIWWLEYGLKEHGRFTGDSLKAGIYSRKDRSHKENIQGRMYQGKYAWRSKYGDSPDAAFTTIKNRIVEVIEAVIKRNLEDIDRIELPETLKWKVAFHYQDRNKPVVVNVFKREMLQLFLGEENEEMSKLNSMAMRQKGNGDLLEFGERIWNFYNLYKSFEDAKSGQCHVWLGGHLYGETEDQYQRFISEEIWQSGYGREDENKSGSDRIPHMVNGDIVALKSASRGEGTKITIKAVGIIKSNPHEKGLIIDDKDGRLLPVKVNWVLKGVNRKIEFESEKGGGNWSWTLKELKYPENIRRLANGVEIKLKNRKGSTDSSSKMEEAVLNKILYGPPGTGKTYNTVRKAVEICDGKAYSDYDAAKARYKELKEEGRIEFVTFHQSYGYEEFIEGIRPETIENSDGTSSISYDVQPGVFKRISQLAGKNSGSNKSGIKEFTDVFKDAVIDKVSKGEKLEITMTRSRYFIKEVNERTIFFDKDKGESKHSLSIKTLQKIYNAGSNHLVAGGVQPYYEALLQYLNECSQVTVQEEKKNYVLIIDEINRGNMSKIFGELITLIEDDKRLGKPNEMMVRLPNSPSETPFGVPKNLHIIGTMNTADRSIAMMDTALRRRFEFEEMMPDAEVFDDFGKNGIISVQLKGDAPFYLNLKDMLNKINQRIEVLYDREHTIGHAYFMSLKESPTIDKLSSIFRNKVIPLLAEYFFEDWEKIRMVLGDNQKENSKHQFVIEKESVKYKDLFGPKVDVGFDDERKVYERNVQALERAESYIGIYTQLATDKASKAQDSEPLK